MGPRSRDYNRDSDRDLTASFMSQATLVLELVWDGEKSGPRCGLPGRGALMEFHLRWADWSFASGFSRWWWHR